jgi:hypothetical protein
VITTAEFDILDALAWHRYLTLGQVKRLVCPWDTSRGYAGKTYDTLKALKRRGYADSGQIDARGVHIWFVTDKGLSVVPQKRRREYVPSTDVATGMDYRHTWGMNEVACAFSVAARERDDECGVLALEHEVLMRQGTGRNRIIADGILQYSICEPGSLHVTSAIVELDRKTRPGRITDRLRAYAEIKRKPSLWKRVLPDGWPTVLFVIADDPRTGPRVGERNWAGDAKASMARCNRLVAYVAVAAKNEPGLRALDMMFCPLPALIAQGPFGPIWRRPGHPEPLDWTGRPCMILTRNDVEKGGAA